MLNGFGRTKGNLDLQLANSGKYDSLSAATAESVTFNNLLLQARPAGDPKTDSLGFLWSILENRFFRFSLSQSSFQIFLPSRRRTATKLLPESHPLRPLSERLRSACANTTPLAERWPGVWLNSSSFNSTGGSIGA